MLRTLRSLGMAAKGTLRSLGMAAKGTGRPLRGQAPAQPGTPSFPSNGCRPLSLLALRPRQLAGDLRSALNRERRGPGMAKPEHPAAGSPGTLPGGPGSPKSVARVVCMPTYS